MQDILNVRCIFLGAHQLFFFILFLSPSSSSLFFFFGLFIFVPLRHRNPPASRLRLVGGGYVCLLETADGQGGLPAQHLAGR